MHKAKKTWFGPRECLIFCTNNKNSPTHDQQKAVKTQIAFEKLCLGIIEEFLR